METDGFKLDGWYHKMPSDKVDQDGRREIIIRLCFGPLETDIYGIENDKFYKEYHYIEGLLEGTIDFDYITKEGLLKELDYEIELSKKYKADDLTKALSEIRQELAYGK